MQEKLKNILEEAKDQLGKASTLQDAEDARVKFLGKKGALTEILRSMEVLLRKKEKNSVRQPIRSGADREHAGGNRRGPQRKGQRGKIQS